MSGPGPQRPLPHLVDHNAATPLRADALAAYLAALARGAGVADELAAVAAALRVDAATLHPGLGGSAAAGAALRGLCAAWTGGHILASGLEHAAVRGTLAHVVARGGWRLTTLATGRDGRLAPAAVVAALRPETRLVVLTAASPETGVVQPLAAVAAQLRRRGVVLFADATQALGRLPPWDAAAPAWGADAASFSAHKLGAVGGLGMVYVRPGVPFAMPPLLRHDDCGAALAALRAALVAPVDWRPVARQRDALEAGLAAAVPGLQVVGGGAPRLPQTSCLHLPGTTGEALLMALDVAGWAVSAGSACQSGALTPSPALTSMGLCAAAARACIRLSLGPSPAALDVDALVAAVATAVRRLRAVAAEDARAAAAGPA